MLCQKLLLQDGTSVAILEDCHPNHHFSKHPRDHAAEEALDARMVVALVDVLLVQAPERRVVPDGTAPRPVLLSNADTSTESHPRT